MSKRKIVVLGIALSVVLIASIGIIAFSMGWRIVFYDTGGLDMAVINMDRSSPPVS